MDPIAAIETINDINEDEDTRFDALEGLAEWIARGGCVPHYAERVTAIYLGGASELVSAVNVAIVNSDLSALEGLGFSSFGGM